MEKKVTMKIQTKKKESRREGKKQKALLLLALSPLLVIPEGPVVVEQQ